MEELHKIAKIFYDTSPEEVKQLAKELFKTMDVDGDGSVSRHEFLEFMRQQGYPLIENPSFFMEIDKDGSGSLEFMEVVTLYYILSSPRRFCHGCGKLITTLYFTCVNCFDCTSGFDVCPDCFPLGNYTHEHNNFLDNFVLLELMRQALLKSGAGISETSHASTTAPSNSSRSAYLEILQLEEDRKRRAAALERAATLERAALERAAFQRAALKTKIRTASNVANIASNAANIASIAASCTIM